MSKPDNSDFHSLFADVKPLDQDKVETPRQVKIFHKRQSARQQQARAEFAFSDGYEAHFPEDKALFWFRGDKDTSARVKALRRGDVAPDVEADLHGLTQQQAKSVLSELLYDAKQRNDLCVQIMHGHGSGVLKQKIPHYLVQHPDVLGFCQAPKQYGGSAAILVLLNIPEELIRR